jgi:beta-mannosidase
MNINLNNAKWQIKGFWPYVPFLGKSIELGNPLLGVTDWIDATVPGGVHFDLLNAGVIENPCFEMNSLKCEWVENRWWMYRTVFEMTKEMQGRQISLLFKGVDYKAHFYLNGNKLGEHEGMFEEIQFNITDTVFFDKENELQILLENAPMEMAQIGHTSMTRTQKSRFNYKWDFCTRMVNIGIWDDVLIEARGEFSFKDTFVAGRIDQDMGKIHISSNLVYTPCNGYKSEEKLLDTCGDKKKSQESMPSVPGFENDGLEKDFQVKIQVAYNDKVLCDISKTQGDFALSPLLHTYEIHEDLTLDAPLFWQTNGMGDQPLYKVIIKVFQEGVLSDEEEYLTGIRSIEYRQNEKSSPDSLPYTFVINGIPTYIKGVNVTPLDLMYGNVTKECYDQMFCLLKNANINMVRVWGGGIIEKEYFYQLCDRYGILVWQEFIQSSSGIDNTPSEDVHFLDLLRSTAIHAVKTKRNHTSHAIWSGGNELTEKNGNPVNYKNKNIRILMDIVRELDPDKLFLPTSASGPQEFLDIRKPGSNHDVHGSWKYEGIKEHYTMFNQSDSLFHSEFGVDGMSGYESLERFLGKTHLKVTNMTDDLVWRHHGEWWDTLARDTEIFGEIKDLKFFTKASQFIQAEGLRYALEANRRRKYENSGSVIWQFNEPWPNVSNTCLVDYDKTPKMAYYWVRKAYNGVFASLSYSKLNWKTDEEFQAEVFLHNSFDQRMIEMDLTILDIKGNILYSKCLCNDTKSNLCSKLGEIGVKIKIPEVEHGIFLVRLDTLDINTEGKNTNLYLFSQKEKEIFSGIGCIKGGELHITKIGADYSITNTGNEICCFVHGKTTDKKTPVFIENNYESLFPGEMRLFRVKTLGGFPALDVPVEWDYLNR